MQKNTWAWVLGVCIIIAALAFGYFYYSANRREETVKVVGYATKDFDSDIAKWSFTLSENTSPSALADGYRRLEQQADKFREVWAAQNIASEDLSFDPVNTSKQFDRNGEETGYRIEQRVTVVCRELDALDSLAQKPTVFIDAGVSLESSYMEYYYSDMTDLKKELLGAATADARDRAARILEGSGRGIGKLLTARSGIFQITERLSTEVADYGMYNTSTREKTIKVTVSAEYSLK